ncbi:MAG TPA: 1,4-alpha-glucan branching protein GlgB [Patescibacteria group bacterium]|nr:1,4-alpha-glucan branching protein GlgB [Patescibacteria group bacterium]
MTDIERLMRGELSDPHALLGAHPAKGKTRAVVVRAYCPSADAVVVVEPPARAGGEPARHEMRAVSKHGVEGLFETSIPGRTLPLDYRLEVRFNGRVELRDDPYRFMPTVGDLDLHLLGEGSHAELYRKLGAHPRVVDGVEGVSFAVWAPAARGVALVGDFNAWDGLGNPMRAMGSSGVWELFMPGLAPGSLYKYSIKGADGAVHEKTDPFAFAMETRPKTASMVWDLARYRWRDAEWMKRRGGGSAWSEPMCTYEVHLGSWRRAGGQSNRWLTYRELADELVPYVKEMGYTHLQLMPPLEHPFDGSWGYQVTGYFAPTSRHGTPDDFRYFMDRCHAEDIAVLIDWVPAHFPSDAHALARFDGTCLYEHADPRQGRHPDWDTLIFNYGRNEVRNFLMASALFWLDQYHVDGLRVDAVSSMLYLDYSRRHDEWVPNPFGGRENLDAISLLKRLNEVVYEKNPGAITVAEESTSWPGVSRPIWMGGLGFGFKWNMGWMHDTLLYFSRDPIHRRHHQGDLTFALLYAFHENFILALSHDEVVHGKGSLLAKMPGDGWQKFANLRALYGYQYAQPGKKLLFMGGEFAQGREWSHDASLDWHLLDDERHRGVQRLVRDLNRIYRAEPSLWQLDHDPAGFEWIDFSDAAASVLAMLRRAKDPADYLVCVMNLTPVPRERYRIGVPEQRLYREILNTDSIHYGGSNLGNVGAVQSSAEPAHGRPFSVELTLPPLSAVYLKPA